jgi:hypothetical protein
MRGSLVVLALAGVVLSDSSVLAQPGRRRGESGARYGWLSSLAEGKRQVAATGKPLMVVLRCVP